MSNLDGDIEVKVTGLRPGEKLYEELLIGENATGTQHPRIMRAEESSIPYENLHEIILELEKSVEENDVKHIVAILTNTISEYTPEADIKDHLWVSNKENIISGLEDGNNHNVIKLSNKNSEKE